jgi:alkanesulfonate monooxygenase SsuD/methylene tetrahydromethanopterin reductase-like flavin-dependent oxidoreductase (luciferase family)
MGIPLYPPGERIRRFGEACEIVKRLFTQPTVDFDGQYYHLREARLEPKPVQDGGIPIWLGAWGPLGMKRAARLADGWIPGPTAKLEKLLSARDQYHAELRAVGKDPAAVPAPLTREVVIAATEERARELAERHLMVNYRDEYGGGTWNHPLIHGQAAEDASRLDAIGKDRFIVGTPEQCIEKIRLFRDAVGADELICRLFFPGMPHEHIMEELRLLAREVMPAFAD